MSETRMEELKKLAMPALQHAELVRLARVHSPSKVVELAAGNWPPRQVKAARSLALLRRDHGQEAFEAFISAMEHARVPQGATEHAQEEEVSEKERRRRAVGSVVIWGAVF